MAITSTVLPSGLLQLFGGEVLAQFEQKNLILPTTRVKTVSGGALSWQFPVINAGTAKYHVAGDNLITTADDYAQLNDGIRGTAKTIYADKLLTCSALLDGLRTRLEAFDSRSEYANQLGAALAKRMDQNIMSVLTQATTLQRDGVTAAAVAAGDNNNIQADTADTDGAALVAAIYEAQARLSARDVPEEDRYVVLAPAQAKLLFANAATLNGGLEYANTLFSPAAATGRIPMIAGFKVIVSNSIRNTATTGVLNQQPAIGLGTNGNDYSVAATPWGTSGYNLANMMAICYHQSAVGTVKIQDVAVETDRMIEYQADLVVAKLAVGHGVLRHESAVAICSSLV